MEIKKSGRRDYDRQASPRRDYDGKPSRNNEGRRGETRSSFRIKLQKKHKRLNLLLRLSRKPQRRRPYQRKTAASRQQRPQVSGRNPKLRRGI